MKHSYPTSEHLSFLLDMIHNREMVLPDFQRDFVWDPYATDELIESIIRNYPAGSLLRIKNGDELLFKPRAFEGAPELNDNHRPSYLILDGQQRLTSLYQALHGVGEHRYYLDLDGLEKNKDLEDCAFYLREREGTAKYGTIEQQAMTLVFPLGRLFDGGGFNAWLRQILKERAHNMDEMLDLQTRLLKIYEQWIKPIEEYEFPMVTLNEETPGEAVCTIFETLNRTGVKLGVFDLLTARFWAKELNLRDRWAKAKLERPIVDDYDIDPYYVLQIIGLLEPGVDKDMNVKSPSIKRGEILNMKVDQARRGWDPAIEALAEVLEIIRDDCGVIIPGLIPYTTMLIPMAAIWSRQLSLRGPGIGASRLKLTKWFWCSAFGAQYEKAPNSQAAKDFNELNAWLSGGEKSESVRDFNISSIQLRNVRPKQRAIYKATMALVMQNGALDFYNRGKITAQLVADKRNPVDDHHIFPQAFLNERNVMPILRDSILNRTYIDRLTNRSLKHSAPSKYFSNIMREHGLGETDILLKSHLLPPGTDSSLLKDDFDQFLNDRENLLMSFIKQKTENS